MTNSQPVALEEQRNLNPRQNAVQCPFCHFVPVITRAHDEYMATCECSVIWNFAEFQTDEPLDRALSPQEAVRSWNNAVVAYQAHQAAQGVAA